MLLFFGGMRIIPLLNLLVQPVILDSFLAVVTGNLLCSGPYHFC